MLLVGASYDLTGFIAEGRGNMVPAVEDRERRQTAMVILRKMAQALSADKADTAALIGRTQAGFTDAKSGRQNSWTRSSRGPEH